MNLKNLNSTSKQMTMLQINYKGPSESIKKRNKIYLFISIIILVIYHLIEYFLGNKMFNHSIEISKELQKVDLSQFSFFISHIFYYSLYIYILAMPFIRKKNEKLFLYVFEIFFSVYLANLLKNVYRILRPSLVSTDLIETGSFCENTYGQPSGHTQAVFSLILMIHSDLSRNMKFGKKFFLFIFTIMFAFLVSFTRVYFGVHSYNQVFMGIVWAVVTFFFFETFEEFFCKQIIIPFIFRSNYQTKRNKVFIYFTSCFIGLFILLIAVYFFSIIQESDEFFSQVINCKKVFENLPNFSERSLGTSSVIIFVYFYFFGIFFYPGNFKTFSDFFYDKNILKFSVRIIFHLIIILLMVLHRVPKINNGKYLLFNITRSFLVHAILGFISTYGAYICFKYLKIGYKCKDVKNKILAQKMSDDELFSLEEMIEAKDDDNRISKNEIILLKMNEKKVLELNKD